MRIIAGPCQYESFELSLEIAKECQEVCLIYDFDCYFKASYDKANRTSRMGIRGAGIDQTMTDFLKLKETLSIKTLTDVHEVAQVEYIEKNFSDAVDVYQIPAFLCRQTDLIEAAVDTGKIVNIKKGQFLAPWDVRSVINKAKGAKEIWITERGTSFGYNTLVNDFTGIQYMLDNFDVPIVYDATHSVQAPGGKGSSSGGNRSYVAPLCRAASALGVDNFFLEVRPDPDESPSDAPNMLDLKDFRKIINDIYCYSYTR